MINRLFSGFQKWLHVRSTVRELQRMDDYALRDIGITRDQIATAVRGGVQR